MDKLTSQALDLGRDLKQHLVEREGVGTDLTPQIVLRARGRNLGSLVFPMDLDMVYRAMAVAISWSAADEVVLINEGFRSTAVDMEGYVHGDFARRFAAGDPTVQEVVTVTIATVINVVIHEMPYRYKGRTVEWLAMRPEPPDRTEGRMPDMFRSAFAEQRRRSDAPMSIVEIGRLLGVPTIDESNQARWS
jgi:hypothetical protein